MCYFISLIAPSKDQSALSRTMARHGRAARPIDNRAVARVLEAGEHQYLTTAGHCDCATLLVQKTAPEALDAEIAKEAAKLARKGWSDAKIERTLADRRKSAERPKKSSSDSLALWTAIIDDLLENLPHVGLLVHFYAGAVENETFQVARREANATASDVLGSIEPDEVLIFRKA